MAKRSNTETLARAGFGYRKAIARVLATFDSATPAQRELGATWYPDAHAVAVELASAAGVSVEHTAAVLAHTSPKTRWSANVAQATALVLADKRLPGALRANVERARAALASDDPLDTFGPTAPKTRNFARNILGDSDAVTIDVWATRIALGPDAGESTLKRRGVYDALADVYRTAAAKRGVEPSTMQATTWIVKRGRAD